MVIHERCGLRCSKAAVLLLNTAFSVLGLFVACVGLWCLTGPGWAVLQVLVPPSRADGTAGAPIAAHFMPTLHQLALGLLVVGVLGFLTYILGCWAAVKENRCGLGLYLLLVVSAIVVEVGVGGLAVAHQERAVSGLVGGLRARAMAFYGAPRQEAFTNALDYVQYQLHCCGVVNHTDWHESRWFAESRGGYHAGVRRLVPLTCCRLLVRPLPHLNPSPRNESRCQSARLEDHRSMRHQEGCVERVREWVRAESGLIVGCGVGVGLLQLAGLLAAATLCRAAKRRGVP